MMFVLRAPQGMLWLIVDVFVLKILKRPRDRKYLVPFVTDCELAEMLLFANFSVTREYLIDLLSSRFT